MCLHYRSLENAVGITFSHSFFLPFWTTLCQFHQIKNCRLQTLSVWNSLNFVIWERVNSLPIDKILKWIKSKAFACNIMLFNTLLNNKFSDWSKLKSICRQQNKCHWKIENCFESYKILWKHCGKRRKYLVPAFSFFPQCFQKASFLWSLKVGIVW